MPHGSPWPSQTPSFCQAALLIRVPLPVAASASVFFQREAPGAVLLMDVSWQGIRRCESKLVGVSNPSGIPKYLNCWMVAGIIIPYHPIYWDGNMPCSARRGSPTEFKDETITNTYPSCKSRGIHLSHGAWR